MEDSNILIDEFSSTKEDAKNISGTNTSTVTDDGSFSAVFLYQVILCICVIIILVLINTFFKTEYTQINSFLKTEFSQKHNMREDFNELGQILSDFFAFIPNSENPDTVKNQNSPQISTSPNNTTAPDDVISDDVIIDYSDILPTLYT